MYIQNTKQQGNSEYYYLILSLNVNNQICDNYIYTTLLVFENQIFSCVHGMFVNHRVYAPHPALKPRTVTLRCVSTGSMCLLVWAVRPSHHTLFSFI